MNLRSLFDWRFGLALLIVAVFALFLSQRANADTTFTAFMATSNSECGTGVGSAGIAYDRDDADTPIHLIVDTGPNGSCSGQGTSVDASVAQRWGIGDSENWYGTLKGGYDQRVLPYEYETRDPGKLFRGVEVVTVSALFGVGYRSGDDDGNWSLGILFDAIEQDYEAGGGTSPFSLAYSLKHGQFEIDSTWIAFGDDDPIIDLNLTWAFDNIEIGGSASYNAGLLDNPAPAYLVADDGTMLGRMGNPSIVYRARIGWRF